MVRDRRILSYGFSKRIIPGKEWEVSAIYDVMFGTMDLDLTKSSLFSTRFPNLEELKLIVATGVESLYFFGEITDPNTVRLANELPEASIPLEIVQLEK